MDAASIKLKKGSDVTMDKVQLKELISKRDTLWFVRIFSFALGVVWLTDAVAKFAFVTPSMIPQMFTDAGTGQPAWLQGWFSFIVQQGTAYPSVILYGTAVLETFIAASFLLGFARKAGYIVSILVGLGIWVTAEGFGGPYGAGSLDTGTGNLYALCALVLIALNATYGNDIYTLDNVIARRFPGWRRISEVAPGPSKGASDGSSIGAMKLSRLAALLYGVVLVASGSIALFFNLSAPDSIGLTTDTLLAMGFAEILIGAFILTGTARKIVYMSGALLTMLVWIVIQALGGPAGTGYTDPGSGIVAALGILLLLSLNKAHGTDPYTVDAVLERRFRWWRKVAEMSDVQSNFSALDPDVIAEAVKVS